MSPSEVTIKNTEKKMIRSLVRSSIDALMSQYMVIYISLTNDSSELMPRKNTKNNMCASSSLFMLLFFFLHFKNWHRFFFLIFFFNEEGQGHYGSFKLQKESSFQF